MSALYYQDDYVTLYHGDFRDVLPDVQADVVIADPPYGETSLDWDTWPRGWPLAAMAYARSLWCFGSMRMFLDRWAEFATWKLSQDVVWEKHNGSGFHADRFRRIHEHAIHLYRGDWADIYHQPPITNDAVAKQVRRKRRPAHTGHVNASAYVSQDGGPRLMTSVMYAPSAHGHAINETQKPVSVVENLIAYACAPGGLVVDLFAGSCTTLVAARNTGRRAIGAEKRESQCEAAALTSVAGSSGLRRCRMTGPDRVDLALRLGRVLQTITAIEALCRTHPVQVPTEQIREAIRDPYKRQER